MKKIKLPVLFYGLWAIFFILVPIVLIVFIGFSVEESGKTVFSLANFKRFFSPIYLSILWASFKLAFFFDINLPIDWLSLCVVHCKKEK